MHRSQIFGGPPKDSLTKRGVVWKTSVAMHAKFKVREGVAWRWNTQGKNSSTCQRLTISYLSDTSNIGWLALSNIIDCHNWTGVTCVRGQHGEAGWQVKHTVNKQTSKQQVNIQVNKLVEQVNKQVNVVKQANKQVNNRACKQTRALQQHACTPHFAECVEPDVRDSTEETNSDWSHFSSIAFPPNVSWSFDLLFKVLSPFPHGTYCSSTCSLLVSRHTIYAIELKIAVLWCTMAVHLEMWQLHQGMSLASMQPGYEVGSVTSAHVEFSS